MSIQTRKEALMDWLRGLDDPNTLAKLEEIAKSDRQSDWWDELPNEVKEGIQRGQEDVRAGRVRPHQEAMAEVRKSLGLL